MKTSKNSTWVDRLRRLAEGSEAGHGISFVAEGASGVSSARSYERLDRRARAIAAALGDHARPGDRVLLLTDQSPEFVETFLGCAYAGMPAVPAFPLRGGPADARVAAMARDSRPTVAVTTRADQAIMKARLAAQTDAGQLRWLAVDQVEDDRADAWHPPALRGDDLLLLQYTSGSTAEPKGVMVTHGNALHNQAAIARAMGLDRSMRLIGWLPLHHSAGLVALLLQPVFLGANCEILAPEAFLKDPRLWLERISRSEQRCSAGGPNFAYDLCLQRIGPERRAGLDLGRWDVAFTGSEPVRAETLRRFSREFALCGFQASAFVPCYGIAEATSVVTSAPRGQGPTIRQFEASALLRNLATPAAEDRPAIVSGTVRELVGNGPAWGGQDVILVDPATALRSPEGQVGEIWVRGPAVALGYWQRPDASEQTYGGRVGGADDMDSSPYLRTGDLGFWHEGELFITGRLKDLIIIRGENHSPLDIEQTAAGADPRLVPGATAAFAIDHGGEERLALVQEVAEGTPADDLARVAAAIRSAVARRHAVTTEVVVLLARGTMPRTPTAKIPRQVIRHRFLAGELDPLEVSRLPVPSVAGPGSAGEPPGSGAVAEQVRDLATQVLQISAEDAATDQPLTELGYDSIAAVELAAAIEARWGVAVSATEILRGVSSSGLAGRVASLLRDGPGAVPPPHTLDLAHDARFDDEVLSQSGGPPRLAPETLFLTGATGFVGAFLLRTLLLKTDAKVRCLVRARSRSEALARLLANASAYAIDLDPYRNRIIPVLGDLAEPDLGLTSEERDALAEDVDAVFHNGAVVNFLQPYEHLRPANVEGTRAILRLAARGRAKALHVISSIAVVPFLARAGCPLVLEDDPLDDHRHLTSGYAQTKWVADTMARNAARRGLPVRVYRLGVITGDSRTGACNPRDFMVNLLKSCVEFGIAPATVPLPVDMTPVDHAAEAVVTLALAPACRDSVFHIVNPEPVPFQTIAEAIRRFGYLVRDLPFDLWLGEVDRRCRHDPSSSLFPYMATLDDIRLPRPGPRFDCRNTLRGLEGQGISCPLIDAPLLETYLNHFLKTGFVSPPPFAHRGASRREHAVGGR